APTSFKSYGPFEGMKRDGHEGGIRVPTLAWGPGNVQAGATSNHPSQFHDWLTTFCDLADIPSPARSDGVSLAPTLTGTGNQETGTVYVEYDTGGSTPNYGDFSNHGGTSRNELQVVYLDGYKGIRNNTTSHSVNFRIYDTLTDLKESNNLAGTSPYFTQLQQRMKDRVLQLRRPNSSASRAYDNEFVPSVSPPVENGLEYQSYEGNWQWVPEFSAMTAVGGSDAADISTTHLSRNNDAGLLYTGYINVPTDGDWTFYTSSDAGTVLRIHDCLVIDDDFNHNGSETSASIKLKAGLHPFRLYYRTASSQPNLNLSWSGPGVAKQSIPSTSFRRDGTPPPEPIANDDQAFTSGTAPVSISVLANDSDDGQPQPLSIQSVSQLALGTATINGNNILYTAAAGKFGQDHFTYTITDGTHTATANVVVDVTVPIANRIWIPLNECDGAIIREAGGTTVGTMAGFADVDAAHIVGKYGHALRFDGVDDQVSLTGVTLPTGNSARTVSAWVRTSSTSPAELQVVFGYGINSNGQRFSIRLDGSATQRLRLEVQGGFIVGSTQLNDGQWHHIAVVVDDFNSNGTTNVNEARLYVDGQRETISSSGSRAIDTSASGGSLIGGSPHAANYSFTGDIDELQIHSSALTDAEVLSLANLDNQTSALWLYRQFANNPPAWNSDDDLDGSELLAEYAFGGNPHISDRNQLTPTVTYNSNDDMLEISYTRRKSEAA
ncbi:MAG: LamG-like jellyroll fold domain-containing protein, partial [Akkermansiaceae bacterium]